MRVLIIVILIIMMSGRTGEWLFRTGLVGGDIFIQYGFGETFDDPVVAVSDGGPVWWAVAEDMGENFWLFAIATCWVGIGPSAFDCVGGKAIKAGFVNEAPILESHVAMVATVGSADKSILTA